MNHITIELNELTSQDIEQVSGGSSVAVNDWDFHYEWKNQPFWQPWQIAIWVNHLYEEHSGPTDTGTTGQGTGHGLPG